jgi:hypothetical protein
LQASTDFTWADEVMFISPQSRKDKYFFYCNVPGYEAWWESGSPETDSNEQVVYPEQGLAVRRKHPADLVFYSTGAVKTGAVLVPIYTGQNLISTMSTFRNVRLSELNLHTGDITTGISWGFDPSDPGVDNLLIDRGDQGIITYFYCPEAPTTNRWWRWDATPADDESIPAGSTFNLVRKSPREPFTWRFFLE